MDGIIPFVKLNDALSAINDPQSGKADLVGGIVPSSQLPSYVSTIVEVDTYADLPETGAGNTIYVVKDENNQQYRWGGTTYIPVGDEKAYYSVVVINMTTMGELKDYVDGINQQGLHILLDMHNFVTDAYVCTAHFYTVGGVNYCQIFDLLNAELIFDAEGFDDTDTIASYVLNADKLATMSDVAKGSIKIATSLPSDGILVNNTEYRLGTISALTINGFADGPEGFVEDWSVVFTADTGITVTLPNTVTWSVATPVFEAGKTYYLSFVHIGTGYIGVWGVV